MFERLNKTKTTLLKILRTLTTILLDNGDQSFKSQTCWKSYIRLYTHTHTHTQKMASRITKQRKEVKVKEDDDEIKNIYDVCSIPGLFKNFLKFLNVKSTLNMSESCLVKNLGHTSFNELITEAISEPKQLFELYRRYRNEFEGKNALVCACDRGYMNDVLLFVNLHRFHKYLLAKHCMGVIFEFLNKKINHFQRSTVVHILLLNH